MMTPLRQRMIQDMQVRNLSPCIIDCYVRQVALFGRYFNRSPELLGLDEIRAYQLHLVHERKLGWGSFNQAICALILSGHRSEGEIGNASGSCNRRCSSDASVRQSPALRGAVAAESR